MARVRELCPIVQVGIRSMDVAEKAGLDPRRVFFAERIQDRRRLDPRGAAIACSPPAST